MPDTIRDRAALLALLPDNTSGDISPQDLRDVVVSVHGVYGGIFVSAGAAAQSLSTTPAKLSGFAGNMAASAGTTPAHTTDNITLLTAGVYLVNWVVNGRGAGAATFIFQVYLNTVAQTGLTARYIAAGTEDFSLHISGLVTAVANDPIEVRGSVASGSTNFTPVDMQLTVYRVA